MKRKTFLKSLLAVPAIPKLAQSVVIEPTVINKPKATLDTGIDYSRCCLDLRELLDNSDLSPLNTDRFQYNTYKEI